VPKASRQALRSQYGWRDDEFVVLTVHWLAFRRGSRLLVPAFEKFVAGGVAGARFVIAGAGPDLERVRREAADSSLASSIEVLGAIPNRELPDLYRAADCFLMPSYEEGFPRVLLEAMATELPLVTTTAGGSADVVGSDYPYIVPTGDVDVIAHALADVHALGGDARVDIGRALRLRVEQHFSTDRVADMFVRLLT
jgi:glycosyltransferase involved in cell wall biosynthesis